MDSNELLLVLNVANCCQIDTLEDRDEAFKCIDRMYDGVLSLLKKYQKSGVVTAINGFDTVEEIDAYIH